MSRPGPEDHTKVGSASNWKEHDLSIRPSIMAHEKETVNDDTARELGKEVGLPFLFLSILYLSRQTSKMKTTVLQFMLEAP